MKTLVIAGILVCMVGCKRSSEPTDGEASGPTETRHLTADEYESFIATPGKLTVVMFHADWCGPRKIQEPVVEAIVAEFGGKAVFGMVDVDDSGELAKSLGVNGIPDLRLYRNGVMVDAMKGAIPKEQVRSHFSIQIAQLESADGSPAERAKTESTIQPMTKEWQPEGLKRR